MEKIFGTYKRKSDGAVFDYQVEFTPNQWAATVRDANGDLAGSPQLGVHGKILGGDELKAQVIDWVERAIRDRVGVR